MRKIIINTLAIFVTISLHTHAQKRGEVPTFQWGTTGKQIDLSWAAEVGSRVEDNQSTNTFKVKDFGAQNDSNYLSTQAIQKAIDACSNAGGGKVLFEPGYYQTGALFVKKGVYLHIGAGTTLLASTDINQYPEFRSRIAGIEMVWPSAVINIIDTQHAGITGAGTIDCRGKVFWDKYWEMRKEYVQKGLRWIVDYDCKRVRGILVSGCSDVTLKDFTLMRTGFWGIQILYSNHCTLHKLTVNNNIGGHGPVPTALISILLLTCLLMVVTLTVMTITSV
jgi:parallel beta-helix repeat protein